MKKIYRQGDVILIQVDGAEAGKRIARDKGRIVLAYGEATGHAHAIRSRDATLRETKEQADAALALGTRILTTRRTVSLEHEEHAPIEVPPGTYLVRIQRVYSPEALRSVVD